MSENLTPEQVEQISEALAAGRKIEAIKIYRDATGKGLKDAKDFIDTLIPKLQEQDPEKYAKLSQGAGCGSAVLAGIAATALGASLRFWQIGLVLICVSFCVAAPLDAQDTDWKAGFARRKITPETPIYMAGYASRSRPFDGVHDDLFVKACAIQDATGRRAVLITSDLIGFRAEVGDRICEEIQKATGLSRAEIILNSSHTHTGPTLSLSPEPTGRGQTAEQAEQTVAYTRRVMTLVNEAAAESLQKLEPAQFSYGIGLATFVMNRREFTERGIRLGFNPRGYVDRSVPVLKITGPDGKLRGVLYGSACHNTTLGGNQYEISGDFAGSSQRLIEAAHPGAQAMFIIGCAGSANPHPRGSFEDSLAHGKQLGSEVVRVLDTKLQPVRGTLKCEFEYAELPLQADLTRERIDQMIAGRQSWQSWTAEKMVKLLERGDKLPKTYRCPFGVWQFGDDLTFVALPGEVVGEYVPLLVDRLGHRKLWIAAYCNDVFGYIPTAQILRQGGYETRGLYAGGVGFFAEEVEPMLVDHVGRLAEKAGRAPTD